MAYISGLAGRGKTTLAVEYAHRYQGDFEAVHWLPCQGRTLVQMAGELAYQLGLKLDGELDAIVRQLTGHCARKRCLLVLDNVEDDTPAQLMPAGRTSVLITTRFDQSALSALLPATQSAAVYGRAMLRAFPRSHWQRGSGKKRG